MHTQSEFTFLREHVWAPSKKFKVTMRCEEIKRTLKHIRNAGVINHIEIQKLRVLLNQGPLYNFTTEVSQSSTFSKTVYNFQILSGIFMLFESGSIFAKAVSRKRMKVQLS